MHLAEERRRHAEAALESGAESRRRGEADLAGDGLERQALRQQGARRIEPQALDEMRRRLAGGVGELAVEAALGEAGAAGERGHVERLVEMALHPVDQPGER